MIEIGLLGSTGSVGTQVLDIVRKNKDKIKVKLLGASKPSEKLLSQIKEFNPRYVYIESGELLNFKNTKVFVGENSLDFLRDLDLDLFIIAIAGVKGIKPTYILLESNKKVATANKEAIICLGELEKDKYKNIIPIDSEHSAIFQIIDRKPLDDVRRIILTASGGPFLNLPLKELENVTIDQTLNHPRWSMGKKISVDSATLINKGFEVIEAHYLFNIPYEKIDVVIHPESIIHGMVEYIDGTVVANMSNPDMRIPISYAIFYPERKYINNNYLDFTKLKSLNFLTPDYKKFPLLKVAIECGKKAGVYPTALTMADEVAVNLYLQGKIKFLDIYKIVIEVIESVKNDKINSIQDLLEFIKYVEKYSLLIAEKYGSS
ncbi:1-deoxy-D-xylulose 5-phosphate reductoisomerase [Sulfurihydrogenibium azorense Az-Fu1]|uniref:1-deoxy-D-xylulose 5-phosphate reductoisomerase n=1 Tax=Sulfurihydrogenibium azorense (strain DSM 15241 / OCM 825 / Az-Fu1) TaxID=204536 RepID=C1DXR1_SULAA|nr:1-deoxy-D-xylulose-5-phosphate reductoisomerase [Sulfurihydrogenibium azorense]ACN98451.1 1-deoxy-D-xylulose 5-phosphate reductoisomerase [Sulfurihydrogenibium azorense Az-Fu1]